MVLTPKDGGGFHLKYTVDRIVDISLKNLNTYINGGEYFSVVDRRTGYKVSGSVSG